MWSFLLKHLIAFSNLQGYHRDSIYFYTGLDHLVSAEKDLVHVCSSNIRQSIPKTQHHHMVNLPCEHIVFINPGLLNQ